MRSIFIIHRAVSRLHMHVVRTVLACERRLISGFHFSPLKNNVTEKQQLS